VTSKKINGFQAPYRSLTFRNIADAQTGRNGLFWMDGTVTQAGLLVTVPPFRAIQQGMIFERTTATTVAASSQPAPYYLTVTAPTPGRTDDLVFTYAKGPEELTTAQVALAIFDGEEWRPIACISINGLIEEHNQENIDTNRVGPYSGFMTRIVGSDYETEGGVLIDRRGVRQEFVGPVTNPIIAADPDWSRVDRILYRRPSDDERRIGSRKFLLGGSFTATPAALYSTPAKFSGLVDRHNLKIVVDSNNAAHVFCVSGAGPTYSLTYYRLASDRITVQQAPTNIITALTDTAFDAIIDHHNVIHLVYSATDLGSRNIYYRRMTALGVLLDLDALRVDLQTGDCSFPRCKLDEGNYLLYIVYQSEVTANNQIFFASYALAGDGISESLVAQTARQITETGGVATQNLIHPDLFVTTDYLMFVVWENQTLTSIQYRRFDDIVSPIDASPITVSSSVRHIGASTLINGASNPRILVSDNEVPHIAFLQNKGASQYGVSIWTPDDAFMRDVWLSTENFTAFELYVEPIFNGIALAVTRAEDTTFVKLQEDYISFKILLSSATGEGVALVRDRLGSMVVAWTEPTNGGFVGKVPGESADMAYMHTTLDSDLLLARIVPPAGPILNWARDGRPGSFYDFLVAHGTSVTIGWKVGPLPSDDLSLGAGLQVLDMFSDINYTVVADDYTMLEGEALFLRLDGMNLTVIPEVLPVAQLPWEEDIAVLGVIKGGEFNPVLLGVAGMEQLDSGESIIFGEDLPQNIRQRLGIINETSYQGYTSVIGQSASDTYPQALSNIDLMAGQNRHIRLAKLDAEWGVEALNVFKIHSECFVHVPVMTQARNRIAPEAKTLSSDGDIVYVTLNREGTGSDTLSLQTGNISTLVAGRNTFIIARRIGDRLAVDSLGAIFTMGSLITSERAEDKRDTTYADVIDFTTTVLPTGTSFAVDSYSLVNGDRVLFAHEDLDGIYQVNGVGAALVWTKLAEFNGSESAIHNDMCHIGDLGIDPDYNIVWRYDQNNVIGDTRWVPAVLSESNKLYLGLDANDPHKEGGEYQDQLMVGQLNNVVQEGDVLEKAIKRLDIRQDVVKRVRLISRVNTSLPSFPATIDNKLVVLGDKILFANIAINGIWQVQSDGYGLIWVNLYEFAGQTDPTAQDLVFVHDGAEVNRTIWTYDSIKGWYRVTTVDDTVPVRAMDKTTTVLPVAGPVVVDVVVDGITILEGELILYGSTTLNRVYRVSYSGLVLFEPMNVFMGSVVPRDGSTVLAQDGTVTDVLWEYDEEADGGFGAWVYLTLTTQNKTYLGLSSPSQTGGTFVDQLTPGQINNVVEEGDILEEAIKRLDVRPDVLKRVRAVSWAASFPSGAGAIVIDGVTLANGDKVLFGNASILGGTGIYAASNIGVGVAWTKLYEFGGLQTPRPTNAVLVTEGTHANRTAWLYNSSILPPWERIAGPSENIWTGADAVTAPTYSGTLSPSDANVKAALATLDKYFRSIQLREHPTNKMRVIITESGVLKTDNTMIQNLINGKVMTFLGAQIDFQTGNIYAADGLTLIDSFTPTPIPNTKYFWYGVSLNLDVAGVDNTITPEVIVVPGTSFGTATTDANKPTYEEDYVVGAVWVHQTTAVPQIDDIAQQNITQISQINTGVILARLEALEIAVSDWASEINYLQDIIASILDNRPNFQRFVATLGGQKIFTLTKFACNATNSIMDIYVFWNGRWQDPSILGDFSDGAFRKNSAVAIEMAETIAAGEEIVVYIWDPAAIFVRTIKYQKFAGTGPGVSIFNLDPYNFLVDPDNTVIDCEYYRDGKWLVQSLLGTFVDGTVRKNSSSQVELSTPLLTGQELVVVRRVPVGSGSGGGGSPTDLENIPVDLGFMTPHSVGTITKPASALYLKDTVTYDIWQLTVTSGNLQIIKVN